MAGMPALHGALNKSGLLIAQEAANYVINQGFGLICLASSSFFVCRQQTLLVQFLTIHTMLRPRYRLEPLLVDRFAAIIALAVFTVLDARERRVDRIQQLSIVSRHRHQK